MKWGDYLGDIILIIAIIPFFLFGFYFVKKVDQFIYDNEKHYKDEIKLIEPTSVRLKGDMPLIEIDREIEKFRQKHPKFEVILKEENEDVSV